MKVIPSIHWGFDLDDFVLGFHRSAVTIPKSTISTFDTHICYCLGFGLFSLYWTSTEMRDEK